MYNGVKVLDVHGHVSAPPAVRAWIVNILASNTAGRSPISEGGTVAGRGQTGREFSDEAFHDAAKIHADYMSDRNIDVQIIGPRPFTMLGWMPPHLLPGWSRVTNDSIFKQ